MENNPIMQRVAMLTEQWKEAVIANKNMRVCCWVGSSSIDYRMIKGFVMYHTSENSNLDDLFFSLNQPFVHTETNSYGTRLIADLDGFISVWNEDKDLEAKTGKINWKPAKKHTESDEKYFIENINSLAAIMGINSKSEVMALALLPQTVTDYEVFAQWINRVIEAGISEKVRIMVFDTYDLKAFEETQGRYPDSFMYLYPDLDMTGAMGQILENTKNKKKNQEEKDAISFQQALLKMNEAISYSNEKSLRIHKNECIQLSIKNNWPHLEALVYFFLHSFLVSQNKTEEAHKVIDKAIQKADLSVEQNIVESEGIKYQYRIAKGNLFFMNKKYVEAGDVFKQCLQLKRDNIDKHVLLGIYQMLGNSIKKSHSRKEAWTYFEEGWQLLKNENLDALKNNTIIMFYAKDMIETASGYQVNLKEYSDKMDEWWGKDWLYKLKQNQHNQIINETAP